MSNDNVITSNFLSAIQKYADEQKRQIEEEVNEFKVKELKKAEEESLEEAYDIIQHEITNKRNFIKKDLALKEAESRKELFILRNQMNKQIFEEATKKLLEFSNSSEYKDRLLKNAKKFAELFGNNNCDIYISESDLCYTSEISAIFNGNATIHADNSIKLGGIKGDCDALNICADSTLDRLLELQQNWFVCNSNLKVV